VHLLLGTDAALRGAHDQAELHLSRAREMDRHMAIAGNNLAWAMAHREPPELEKALALIDAIAAQWPNVAAIRDTRGQILVKLGRDREALVDLEAALPRMRGEMNLHRALATAYANLGQQELAAEHRRLAEEAAEKSSEDLK
jgi:predicted Zn-dependent protease